jgi:hypothetical protein
LKNKLRRVKGQRKAMFIRRNSSKKSYYLIIFLLLLVSGPSLIYAIGSDAIIITTAGIGTSGFSGDGGLATEAQLDSPTGIALDKAGNLYIADRYNHRIRKVIAATGVITTVAGSGPTGPGGGGFSGDSGLATDAQLNLPARVALDEVGNLCIADSLNNRIRKVIVATGVITTVAGTGIAGYGGDDGPATEAQLQSPLGVAVDQIGDLYIADANNHRIRKVIAATDIITTVAGSGVAAYGGDNGPASDAQLNYPVCVAMDGAGNLYIADAYNHRIRKVIAATGIITTVSGSGPTGPGNGGFSGDGGPATDAELNFPSGVAVDGQGNLFIADNGNHRIRKVIAATGVITTVAGTGIAGYGGDNGPASDAQLKLPTDVAFGMGNLYIADQGNHRIRKVEDSALLKLFLPIIMKN